MEKLFGLACGVVAGVAIYLFCKGVKRAHANGLKYAQDYIESQKPVPIPIKLYEQNPSFVMTRKYWDSDCMRN